MNTDLPDDMSALTTALKSKLKLGERPEYLGKSITKKSVMGSFKKAAPKPPKRRQPKSVRASKTRHGFDSEGEHRGVRYAVQVLKHHSLGSTAQVLITIITSDDGKNQRKTHHKLDLRFSSKKHALFEGHATARNLCEEVYDRRVRILRAKPGPTDCAPYPGPLKRSWGFWATQVVFYALLVVLFPLGIWWALPSKPLKLA